MPDQQADHYCPVYQETISADFCYDSMMCLSGFYDISTAPELLEVGDLETAEKLCQACPYSK